MKKMRCLIACLCLGACTLFSCSDEENVSESTKLTPDEHKEKLEKIGLDAIAKVNAADHEDLLRTMDYFYEIVDNSNLEVERDESATAVAGMLKAAASICKQNNLGGISHFASPQNDLYAAAQYYGIYTYDENRNRWRRTDSENSLEFHFENQVGDPVVISVSASGSARDLTDRQYKERAGTAKSAGTDIEIPHIRQSLPRRQTKFSSDFPSRHFPYRPPFPDTLSQGLVCMVSGKTTLVFPAFPSFCSRRPLPVCSWPSAPKAQGSGTETGYSRPAGSRKNYGPHRSRPPEVP